MSGRRRGAKNVGRLDLHFKTDRSRFETVGRNCMRQRSAVVFPKPVPAHEILINTRPAFASLRRAGACRYLSAERIVPRSWNIPVAIARYAI
jgi:hypothetical protein